MPETLTVEQHKLATELGIKLRKDGKWGYKRKCANEACDEVLDDHCYCDDTFDGAVYGAKMRSAYTCSRRCWVDAGFFLDMLFDYSDDDLVDCTGSELSIERIRELLTILKRKTKESKWDSLTKKTKDDLTLIMDGLLDDVDWDIDEGECGCEA